MDWSAADGVAVRDEQCVQDVSLKLQELRLLAKDKGVEQAPEASTFKVDGPAGEGEGGASPYLTSPHLPSSRTAPLPTSPAPHLALPQPSSPHLTSPSLTSPHLT